MWNTIKIRNNHDRHSVYILLHMWRSRCFTYNYNIYGGLAVSRTIIIYMEVSLFHAQLLHMWRSRHFTYNYYIYGGLAVSRTIITYVEVSLFHAQNGINVMHVCWWMNVSCRFQSVWQITVAHSGSYDNVGALWEFLKCSGIKYNDFGVISRKYIFHLICWNDKQLVMSIHSPQLILAHLCVAHTITCHFGAQSNLCSHQWNFFSERNDNYIFFFVILCHFFLYR